jgi:hypothetical protein
VLWLHRLLQKRSAIPVTYLRASRAGGRVHAGSIFSILGASLFIKLRECPASFQDQLLPEWGILGCPSARVLEHHPERHERKHPDKHAVVFYPINELDTSYDMILFGLFWQGGPFRFASYTFITLVGPMEFGVVVIIVMGSYAFLALNFIIYLSGSSG